MMDVVISSGWRTSSGIEAMPVEALAELAPTPPSEDRFISRHGRYEITLSRVASGWKVEYTSSGRLFGPRVCIYEAIHSEPRHAAWDVMARVIRATDDESIGVLAGRNAGAWLMEHRSIC
jgi:hypothetical protein